MPASEGGIAKLIETLHEPNQKASKIYDDDPSMLKGLTGQWRDRYPPSDDSIEEMFFALKKYIDQPTVERHPVVATGGT